ncbi:peptidylprolyl isomerase [Modestobacter sp. VKM Ac-2676]|nr:peptidylprolyl isomerase [Modestobacter sp. VKM Ac-2676]
MPTNKQRREAAQRHLQRQLERREQQARTRRRNLLIGVTVIAVLAVVAAVFIITGITGEDDTADTAGLASDNSPPALVVDGSDGTCDFTEASRGETTTDVGIPPAEVPTSGTTEVTMTTNVGAIPLTLDQESAPCASASMVYLAQQGFYDGTICHRETASETLSVLQCGDPSGTGTGGPSYEFPTQVTGEETYPRGTLAMANSGSGFDGSQFFLVYADSTLPPDYTVFGTIGEAGLQVLDTIAAAGIEGGASDGAPAQPVTIESMTVQQ